MFPFFLIPRNQMNFGKWMNNKEDTVEVDGMKGIGRPKDQCMKL